MRIAVFKFKTLAVPIKTSTFFFVLSFFLGITLFALFILLQEFGVPIFDFATTSWSPTVFFAKINNFFSRSNHFLLISAIDSQCRLLFESIFTMTKIFFFKATSWLIMLYQDCSFNSCYGNRKKRF